MVPRLVPEISSLDAFCDTGAGGAGIGDSRSWIWVNAKLVSGSSGSSAVQHNAVYCNFLPWPASSKDPSLSQVSSILPGDPFV